MPYADLSDPQTLNLYQFVGGNPASKADPDGHEDPPRPSLLQIIKVGGPLAIKLMAHEMDPRSIADPHSVAAQLMQKLAESCTCRTPNNQSNDGNKNNNNSQSTNQSESGGQKAPSNGTSKAGTSGTGRAPSKIDRAAFNAERKAFWKAEAKTNPENYSAENLARMEKGKPPIGPDGHPIELHHVDRTQSGPLEPMTRTDHRLGENMKKNHPD